MKQLIILLILSLSPILCMAQGYTKTEYEIYDYVMETTSISTEQAKRNMATKHNKSVDEITKIVSKVMNEIFFSKESDNKEELIKEVLKDFAKPKNLIIRRDFALIGYEHTFNAWNDKDVNRKTKQYMSEVLDAVITHTDSERIRIAPYHPGNSGGIIAVALLEIERGEYRKGKDVEQYKGFGWKN
ncbi:MAG: hypothetical protein WD267_10180 [Balneolales bacterium]